MLPKEFLLGFAIALGSVAGFLIFMGMVLFVATGPRRVVKAIVERAATFWKMTKATLASLTIEDIYLFIPIVIAVLWPFALIVASVRAEIRFPFMAGVSAAGITIGLAAAPIAAWRKRKVSISQMMNAAALSFAGSFYGVYCAVATLIAIASD